MYVTFCGMRLVMKDIGNYSNYFKNPIGVIGIFLVLTEAIAGLVITNSSLIELQNTILVIFISIFPCFVLLAFYKLVTKHHEKLYSPSDYKDEQNFVNTYNPATQKEEINVVNNPNKVATVNTSENDISVIKDALTDVIEVQKKIIPTLDDSSLSDSDKTDYVSNMEGYLYEMEDKYKTLKVEVNSMYMCSKLVEELTLKGYLSSIYTFTARRENKKFVKNANHEAIWLGSEIPLTMAIEVIKLAKHYYPHLKYIDINDCSSGAPEYVKYQIFIGGASSTAIEQNLVALTRNDFDKIYSMDSKDKLHNYIRSLKHD